MKGREDNLTTFIESLPGGPRILLFYLTAFGLFVVGLLWHAYEISSALDYLNQFVPKIVVLIGFAGAFAVGAMWSLWYLLEPKSRAVRNEIRIALSCLLLGDALLLGALFWVGWWLRPH